MDMACRVRLVGIAEHVQRVHWFFASPRWCGWVEATLEGPQGQSFSFRDGEGSPLFATPEEARQQAAKIAASIVKRWGDKLAVASGSQEKKK